MREIKQEARGQKGSHFTALNNYIFIVELFEQNKPLSKVEMLQWFSSAHILEEIRVK